jgi:transcriptional regulator with XRE-family HTH domain
MPRPKFDKEGFGRRAKSCREQLGLTQTQVARASGMSQSNVDSIEHGKVGRTGRILELAAALSTTPEWLFHEKGPQFIHPPNPREQVTSLLEAIPVERLGAAIQFLKTLSEERSEVA